MHDLLGRLIIEFVVGWHVDASRAESVRLRDRLSRVHTQPPCLIRATCDHTSPLSALWISAYNHGFASQGRIITLLDRGIESVHIHVHYDSEQQSLPPLSNALTTRAARHQSNA